MQKTIVSAGRKSLAALTVFAFVLAPFGLALGTFAPAAFAATTPTTVAAAPITSTDATLKGINGDTAATHSSFWVSTTTFSTAVPVQPIGVYSTADLGTQGVSAAYSAALSSATSPAGLLPIIPGTTYYYAAWSEVGDVWSPGAVMNFITAAPATLQGALAAQDFGVMNASGVNGYTAGFGLTDATLADAQSIVVQLYAGTTLLQTNTATTKLGTDYPTATSFSGPFDVSGTFNYATDGYWTNVRGAEYGKTMVPTSVVATVTLTNGKVVTATNTNLTGTSPAVTTDAATAVASTGATLNGVNANTAATDSSFWVSTSTFSTASSAALPSGVFSTPSLGALAPDAAFSSPLSSVAGVLPVTPNTIYYFAAWTNIGGTWQHGAVMTFTTSAATVPTTPVITTISPNTGAIAGGDIITIAGTGFTGATTVKFGTTATTSFTVNAGGTSIIVHSPATSTAGVANITVTTPVGTSVVNEGDRFTYSASSGSIGGTVTGPAGALMVTSITPVKTSAISDNTYADGWSYIFNITVPTNETNLSMSFANWLAADANTIPVAGNMQISSAQALASTTPVTLTAANVFSSPLNMIGDLSTTTPGLQVQVLVQVKIPAGSANDSYTTNYGVQTLH